MTTERIEDVPPAPSDEVRAILSLPIVPKVYAAISAVRLGAIETAMACYRWPTRSAPPWLAGAEAHSCLASLQSPIAAQRARPVH